MNCFGVEIKVDKKLFRIRDPRSTPGAAFFSSARSYLIIISADANLNSTRHSQIEVKRRLAVTRLVFCNFEAIWEESRCFKTRTHLVVKISVSRIPLKGNKKRGKSSTYVLPINYFNRKSAFLSFLPVRVSRYRKKKFRCFFFNALSVYLIYIYSRILERYDAFMHPEKCAQKRKRALMGRIIVRRYDRRVRSRLRACDNAGVKALCEIFFSILTTIFSSFLIRLRESFKSC